MKYSMSGKMYDTLKYLAQVALPALATLYFALAQIWGLPYAEQIVGTITAVDTFLGVLLKLSTNKYQAELNDPDCLAVKEQREGREAAGEYEGVDYADNSGGAAPFVDEDDDTCGIPFKDAEE